MIPVFPRMESVDNGAVGASSGVDVSWDAVCAGVEPLVKGGKVDVVISVSVV